MSPLRTKLLRDLRRQGVQFGAVAVTVFLGITLFAASYDSFQNLTASYDETAQVARFANLTVSGGDIARFAEIAASEQGVGVVETRTVSDVPLSVPGTRLLGRVVGLPEDAEVNRLTVHEGSLPARGEVAVEEHLASHFGLGPGDTVEVLGPDGWTSQEVSGVVASAEYIWPAKSRVEVLTTPDNFGVVFAPQEAMEALTGASRPNQAVVWFEGGQPDPALERRLSAAAPDAVEVYTRAEQPSNAALEEDLRGFEELSLFFPILFLSAAGMAGYVMINRLVHAQRPLVGVLLANGFSGRQVLRHYLGYGLVPGVVGAVPGAIAGSLLARVITDLYTGILSVPVTVIEAHPTTLVAAVGLGIAAALAAAWGPARAASRVAPAASMRDLAPSGGGRRSILERIVPPVRRASIRTRMGLRGIERNPRRTVSTVLGVVLSLVLVLVSWGMLDTIQILMDRQFQEIEGNDATVHLVTPSLRPPIDRITAVDGVARAEPMLQLPGSVGIDEERVTTALVALPADTTLHRFFDPSGEEVALPDSGALVAEPLLDGVEVGEDMEMTVADIGTVDVRVAGVVDEPLGSFVYLSFAEAERLAGGPVPVSSLLLSYEDGADPGSVRAAALDLEEVAAFEDADAMADVIRGFMGLFYGFVGVMLAFGAAMAFALIFNAMSVNIAERTREVGTLLAVGVERRTVSRLITTENLAVALLGVPIGLVAGYWVSAAALASFESDMFRLDLEMRPTTFVISAVAILLVALLSQRPGLAAIGRMDVARIIKERSV